MRIENLKEFINTTKKSKSTIIRFYKKNPDLFKKTILKNNKRYYPEEHVKYFDSEIMYQENKELSLQNKSMKNLINGLMDRDSLPTRLWYLDWSYIFTIPYKAERNKKSCYKQISGLYELLEDKYGNETTIRLFFTTESFSERRGYHNHFILHIGNKKLHEKIVKVVREYFSFDRIDMHNYDPFQGNLFYIAKTGLINEDWDLFGSNLVKDGLK